MSAGRLRIGAVGDLYLGHPLAAQADAGFTAALERLRACDLRFGNLEVVLLPRELPGNARAPGAWAGAASARGTDLLHLGLDAVSTANNHAGDYGADGVLGTCAELDRLGVAHAGSGVDLEAARAPAMVTTAAGRVAFVAATSSFLPEVRAGRRRDATPGRAGVSCVRFGTRYHVDAQAYDALERIGASMPVDLARHRERPLERDYAAERGAGLALLGSRFLRSDRFEVESWMAPDDRDDVVRAIRAARSGADWVVMSLHSQEFDRDPSEPAAFARELCHAAIDAGADAVIGHGEHGVRGVEIHRGRPIFHGLGPFVFQPYAHASQPADFFDAQGMADASLDEAYRVRRERAGFQRQPKCWEGVLLELDLSRDALPGFTLHPLRLRPSAASDPDGLPRLATGADGVALLLKVQALSERLGARLYLDTASVTLGSRAAQSSATTGEQVTP